MSGQEQLRFQQHLSGANPDHIDTVAGEWRLAYNGLDHVSEKLEKAGEDDTKLTGDTGEAFRADLVAKSEKMHERALLILKGAQILEKAATVLRDAQTAKAQLDAHHPTIDEPAPYQPPVGPVTAEDEKAKVDHDAKAKAYADNEATRELVSKTWADKIDTVFAQLMTQIQDVRVGLDPTSAPPKSPTGNPGPTGPTVTSTGPSTGNGGYTGLQPEPKRKPKPPIVLCPVDPPVEPPVRGPISIGCDLGPPEVDDIIDTIGDPDPNGPGTDSPGREDPGTLTATGNFTLNGPGVVTPQGGLPGGITTGLGVGAGLGVAGLAARTVARLTPGAPGVIGMGSRTASAGTLGAGAGAAGGRGGAGAGGMGARGGMGAGAGGAGGRGGRRGRSRDGAAGAGFAEREEWLEDEATEGLLD